MVCSKIENQLGKRCKIWSNSCLRFEQRSSGLVQKDDNEGKLRCMPII
ncbi:hypothetical protein T03_4749 [Trichinella britovi]|uniref:Uncharacterized protein n=1 Tax=Trichinella britovi TaxID=45882 RepID=A0A0V1C473_TRIBR|nr:hypothetical protein T03_4749 [Trichinella britovi]